MKIISRKKMVEVIEFRVKSILELSDIERKKEFLVLLNVARYDSQLNDEEIEVATDKKIEETFCIELTTDLGFNIIREDDEIFSVFDSLAISVYEALLSIVRDKGKVDTRKASEEICELFLGYFLKCDISQLEDTFKKELFPDDYNLFYLPEVGELLRKCLDDVKGLGVGELSGLVIEDE